MSIAKKAKEFAEKAHASIDQKRKYTGEPYIVHPIEVAAIVATVTEDEAMIAAAYLHDTVEDTETTLEIIEMEFGSDIAALVEQLTDVSRLEDGNRAQRKALDLVHTSKASPRAKTIKLARPYLQFQNDCGPGSGICSGLFPRERKVARGSPGRGRASLPEGC